MMTGEAARAASRDGRSAREAAEPSALDPGNDGGPDRRTVPLHLRGWLLLAGLLVLAAVAGGVIAGAEERTRNRAAEFGVSSGSAGGGLTA